MVIDYDLLDQYMQEEKIIIKKIVFLLFLNIILGSVSTSSILNA